MIYTIRVTAGQEKIVAQMLAKKARAEKLDVFSVTYVENIKGYLFVEVPDKNVLAKLIQKLRHVKGFLKTPVKLDEIKKLISLTKQPIAAIEPGDIIEVTSGPFKGERAKVVKVDEGHDEITVELVEVAVPIPITVKTKTIKIFQRAADIET